MEPGINKSVLQHLKGTSQQKNSKEKVAALVFDEIALKPRLIYTQVNDYIDGFQDLRNIQEGSSQIADHALVSWLQTFIEN